MLQDTHHSHHDEPDTLPDTTKPSFPQPRKGRWIRRLLWTCVVCVLIAVSGISGLIWWMGRDLPDLRSVEAYRPWRITRVMDLNQRVIMELAEQRRRVVPYQKLPKHLIHAIVSAEDAHFFKHKGIAYTGIIRAFWKNLWRAKGAPKQGGSTITQQVVKTFLLHKKQTYKRKIREAILARQIEIHLRKWEILYLYLNQIDFGRGCFGVEEAARYYFGKSATKLTISESAILAGIPKNPERYNPANSTRLTKRRRNYVLRRMWQNGYLSHKQYKALRKQDVKPRTYHKGPAFQQDYYTEAVRQKALSILEDYIRTKRGIRSRQVRKAEARKMLMRGGLRIETALHPPSQRQAQRALRRGLRALDRRRGYRGPHKHIPPSQRPAFVKRLTKKARYHNHRPQDIQLVQALVTGYAKAGMTIQTGRGEGLLPWSSLKWASQRYASTEKGRLIRHKRPIQRVVQAGDVIWVQRTKRRTPKQLPHYSLEQIPVVQGAFVAIDPRTHSVRALVGGWHPISHPFNRALWSKRQPGSTFKPILYTAALASRQFTPATLVNDTYLEMNVNGKRWIPTNANRSYRNKAIRLRDALAFSVNTVAVRVLDRISPYRTIAMARKLGIRAPLTLKPSLALGASAVQPLALVNAYATIAGRGMYDDPVMITRILTHNGQTIYNRLPNPRRAISPSVAFLMTSMLQDVVQKGTAKRARVLARPIAGKTGTTNDARNAWFVGYTPEICAGVWIGFDDQTPLGRRESGASAALPVFIDWMKQYHKTPSGYRPPSLFRVPDGITHVKIDPETGELAPIHQTDYLFEAFLDGTEPTRYARNQGPLANPRDFIRE